MRGSYQRRQNLTSASYYQLIAKARAKCRLGVTPDGAQARPEAARGKALANQNGVRIESGRNSQPSRLRSVAALPRADFQLRTEQTRAALTTLISLRETGEHTARDFGRRQARPTRQAARQIE